MSKKTFREHIEEQLDATGELSDNIDHTHQVDNMWCVVAISNEGGEGLPALFRDGVALPLMTTDIDNVPKLIRYAKDVMKKQPGIKRIVLRHFSDGVDEEL